MGKIMPQDPIMELKQVSLAAPLGSSYLLQDISFSIPRGEWLAVVGASGAGKTTLLRLLNRLIEPTSGSIEFKHQDLKNLNSLELRRQVVLVLQEPKLLGMSVQQALAYPLMLQKIAAREINRRVSHWINILGIPQEWLERNELQLSLGQRQLVTIARALIMESQLLLLDEPTSALDVGNAMHVMEVLQNLVAEGKTSIVMVNHQLKLVEQFSDRVLYLDQGKLLQDQLNSLVNWQELHNQIAQARIQTEAEWE